MKKCVLSITLVCLLGSQMVLAGDEDKKAKEAASQIREEPAPTALPEEWDTPAPVLQEYPEVAAPIFEEPEEIPSEPAARKKSKRRVRKNPDANLDYSELLSFVQPMEGGRGVLPPAQGTRGYRPNLVAASVGDRTPGYGAILEYSFNRLGIGSYFSYRNLRDSDTSALSQGFLGLYGTYRWLPFDFSPYLLAGIEFGSETPEQFGGALGFGMEARIYSGWTILLGYTYHSTARKAFMGGAFGWSF